jgi:hypothetical protein
MSNLPITGRRKLRDVRERFEEKFYKCGSNECWDWLHYKDRDGYGSFYRDGITTGAHRASYELYVGVIPDGMKVCHKCDRPSCVNPSHLFLGSAKDNWGDMVAKGREVRARGERHGCAKLTWQDACKIRSLEGTASQAGIAKQFGVTAMVVNRILRNRRWLSAS